MVTLKSGAAFSAFWIVLSQRGMPGFISCIGQRAQTQPSCVWPVSPDGWVSPQTFLAYWQPGTGAGDASTTRLKLTILFKEDKFSLMQLLL